MAATTAIITLIIQYGSSLLKNVVHNIATYLAILKKFSVIIKWKKILDSDQFGTSYEDVTEKSNPWKFGDFPKKCMHELVQSELLLGRVPH